MDKFILTERVYKKNPLLLKEERKIYDMEYNNKIKEKIKEKEKEKYKEKYNNKDKLILLDKELKQKKYTNDFFHFKEKGDILLNNWIINQKEPIIIFLSEFIPGTKISSQLEKFRPIIKNTPLISIEEYRKKKKIGEEGVKYLKRLRDKYGIIVLKVLWANLNM